MTWSAAIANLFRAVAAYFELKNRSFYYDILNKSRQQQKELISEIEKLRASRNIDDARVADVVRMQLLQEQRFSKHLSATYAATDAVSGH